MCADMFIRWDVKPSSSAKSLKLSKLIYAPVSPETNDGMDSPNAADILKSQRKSTEDQPKGYSAHLDSVQRTSGVFSIPKEDKELQLGIMVVAYTACGGHRCIKPTQTTAMANFYWHFMGEGI